MQLSLNTIAISTCFIAAILDVRSGKIANWLTIPAIVIAFAFQVFFGLSWEMVDWQRLGLSAFLLVLLLPVILAPRGLGGGDLKLILVLVVTLGILRTVFIIILAAFTAAIAMGLRGWYDRIANGGQPHDSNLVRVGGGNSCQGSTALAPFFAGYCMLVLIADYCLSLEYE